MANMLNVGALLQGGKYEITAFTQVVVGEDDRYWGMSIMAVAG